MMKWLTSALLVGLMGLAQAQEEIYDICPIKISESIPRVILEDAAGFEVDLKAYVGSRPVVIVFYRGGWCPYCTRHLSALQEAHGEIDSLGYELIAITPDRFEKIDSTTQRTRGLDYVVLSDSKALAMEAFGVGWKVNQQLYNKYKYEYGMDTEWWSGQGHHVLPVPAVFIIREGKIVFEYVNPDYSTRLSPEVLISLLKG